MAQAAAMRRPFLFFVAMILLAGCATAPAPADRQQIFIVRHMEKASGDDPSLTPQGAANAQALARQLAGSAIASIYATATRRAQQSAAPLSAMTNVPIAVYDPRAPAELVEWINRSGRNALIVGHSNTVPELVERLGGTRPAPLSESDYGTVYRVTAGCAEVDRLSVGEAIPSPRPC